MKDEEQLYRQLSDNVGDDLVEDLYLDSHRRLTSGVLAVPFDRKSSIMPDIRIPADLSEPGNCCDNNVLENILAILSFSPK